MTTAMAMATTMAGCADEGEALPGPSRAAQCEASDAPMVLETFELAMDQAPTVLGDTAYALADGELMRLNLSNPAAAEEAKPLRLPEDPDATHLFRYGERLVTVGAAVTVYELSEGKLEVMARTPALPLGVTDAGLVGDTLILDAEPDPVFVDLSRSALSSELAVERLGMSIDRMWSSADRLILAGPFGMHAMESVPGQGPEVAATFSGSRVDFAMADPQTGLTFAIIEEGGDPVLRVLQEQPSGRYTDVGRTDSKKGFIAMEVVGDELLAFRPDILMVYDISNPQAPTEVERHVYRDQLPSREVIDRVDVAGPYALFTGGGKLDLIALCEPEPME